MLRGRTNRWIRPGLVVLFAQAAFVAGWALASPRSFYRDFPLLGGSWIDALPPFNDHLIRDVGALYAGFALLFLMAAVSLEPAVIRASLIAWLPFAAVHLWFHLTHIGSLDFADRVLQIASLVLVLVLPLLLLRALRRRSGAWMP